MGNSAGCDKRPRLLPINYSLISALSSAWDGKN
jgi:hypothetical protein